jgi:hypothetical protein
MAAAIPVILAVATVASTAYSVYSNAQSGKEQEHQRDKYERQLGVQREANLSAERDRRQRVLASQEARYSASGLKMEGSPLLVQADTIAQSEENLARILQGASLNISASESQGKQEQTATTNRTAQSLLGGAESTYKIGKTYNWWS